MPKTDGSPSPTDRQKSPEAPTCDSPIAPGVATPDTDPLAAGAVRARVPMRGNDVITTHGLFADASQFDLRYVPDYDDVTRIVEALRILRLQVVLTSGSFDVLHEGHSMYLEAARMQGDFLIVGVDSDQKIRGRKGPGRPAVPEQERLRMVTHQRGVGLVTLKRDDDPRWALINAVRPDVLVATEETYTPDEIAELEDKYCGRVVVLPRMATISTSARLRRLQLELASALTDRLPEIIQKIADEIAPPR